MNFAFTDEQNLLRESAGKFVANDYSLEARRAIVDGEDGFSREHWATFAALGWLGLGIPEDDGGLGGGAVETSVLMEAFGRGLVVEPYLSTAVLGGGLVRRAGSPEQRAALLPRVAAGEIRLAFAHAEAEARFDAFDVATRAVAGDGGEYVLDGAKSVVLDAAAADHLLVTARTGGERRDPGGISLFLVDREADGLGLRAYPTVDGRRACEVTLDGVRVASRRRLGRLGEAYPAVDAALDAGTVAVCAEAVGIMQVLVDTTREFLGTRRQFGQPLAAFQVLQHRLVDMFVALESSKSMAYMAATFLDAVPPAERRRRVSAAKVQIGEAGRLVGEDAVQLHGGIGMTDELAVGHYFKRLAMIGVEFGDVDFHLARMSAVDTPD